MIQQKGNRIYRANLGEAWFRVNLRRYTLCEQKGEHFMTMCLKLWSSVLSFYSKTKPKVCLKSSTLSTYVYWHQVLGIRLELTIIDSLKIWFTKTLTMSTLSQIPFVIKKNIFSKHPNFLSNREVQLSGELYHNRRCSSILAPTVAWSKYKLINICSRHMHSNIWSCLTGGPILRFICC